MNLARPRSPSRVISCSPATSACFTPVCDPFASKESACSSPSLLVRRAEVSGTLTCAAGHYSLVRRAEVSGFGFGSCVAFGLAVTNQNYSSRQRLPRWLQCDGSGSGYQSDCTDGSLETPPICAKAVS